MKKPLFALTVWIDGDTGECSAQLKSITLAPEPQTLSGFVVGMDTLVEGFKTLLRCKKREVINLTKLRPVNDDPAHDH